MEWMSVTYDENDRSNFVRREGRLHMKSNPRISPTFIARQGQ